MKRMAFLIWLQKLGTTILRWTKRDTNHIDTRNSHGIDPWKNYVETILLQEKWKSIQIPLFLSRTTIDNRDVESTHESEIDINSLEFFPEFQDLLCTEHGRCQTPHADNPMNPISNRTEPMRKRMKPVSGCMEPVRSRTEPVRNGS